MTADAAATPGTGPTAVPLQLRQGDVLLVAIGTLPDDAEPEPVTTPLVLAYGEATGHAHVIDRPGARAFTSPAGRLLVLPDGAELVHQEHAPVAVPPGIFRVVIQREYVPAPVRGLAWRTVVD